MGPLAPALALGCRWALAGVLLFAAVAKWRARSDLPAQVEAMGVPRRAAPVVAALLPATEAVVALGLAAWVGSTVPAWVALALFGAFTVLVARAVPRHVPCPCFGSPGTRPVGSRTLVRNGVLLAAAVVATGSAAGARAPGALALAVAFGAALTVVVRLTD